MIKGSCFHLRHLKKDELPRYTELINHPDSKGDFLSLEVMLPGTVEQHFEEHSRSKEIRETFVIIDENDAMIGRVFHFKSVPYFNSREIGYALFSAASHGKGIMSEAVQLLTDYLFNTMLINRLDIHMNVNNIASEKVAIKCGFKMEGIARGAAFSRGKHSDIKMYALLRDEWEQR
ncbi:GNAT family N-acetyltransferase [Undibacterium sp. Ren11W]|uniref:GNAT family N-acetyltransferase n=1 Tax=Undibacterium sp. Ren11W TaxID=3413045 RepID=UPI003BF24452